MRNINCVIIDDEPFARELIEMYVEKIPFLNLLSSCSSVMEAMLLLNDRTLSKNIDLIISDVDMPGVSGMEFIKSLERKPKVIFITAHSKYAVEGFEVNASDYIVKPVSFERFFKSILKVQESLSTGSVDDQTLFVKDGHKIYKIDVMDIAYLEGMRDYIKIVKKDESSIVTHSTMKKMLDELPDMFIRVHKSFIVNAKNISTIYGNMVELKSIKFKVPIGKQFKEDVLQKLNINA